MAATAKPPDSVYTQALPPALWHHNSNSSSSMQTAGKEVLGTEWTMAAAGGTIVFIHAFSSVLGSSSRFTPLGRDGATASSTGFGCHKKGFKCACLQSFASRTGDVPAKVCSVD